MKLIINLKPEAKLARIEALSKELKRIGDGNTHTDSFEDVIESITCEKPVN